MAREWKPGDVAMVTRLGRPEAAVRIDPGANGSMMFDWYTAHGSAIYDDARPLVVLDPEDEDAAEVIVQAFVAAGVWRTIPLGVKDGHAHRREQVQAALRSLAEEPRAEEPTDPKARVSDRRDNIWRLLADGDWVCTSGPDIGEYLAWWQLAERGPISIEGVPS